MTLEMLWYDTVGETLSQRHADGTTNAASASRAPTPLGLRSQANFESVGAPGQPQVSTPPHGQHKRPQRVAAVSCARLRGDDAIAGPSAPAQRRQG